LESDALKAGPASGLLVNAGAGLEAGPAPGSCGAPMPGVVGGWSGGFGAAQSLITKFGSPGSGSLTQSYVWEACVCSPWILKEFCRLPLLPELIVIVTLGSMVMPTRSPM